MLKLTGAAAAAGLLGVGTAAGQNISKVTKTQEDGYERWEVPANTDVVVTLGDGDSFEDVLIDQTADGANLYVVASNNPSNWTIRNVGWKGMCYTSDVDGWAGVFHMVVSGDGLIENVFIDNRTEGQGSEIGGALTARHHSGTIDVRNTYIAGCGNNAFYASSSGKTGGGGGAVRFYNCYHRDNTVSQFRVGGPGSLVKNCVGVVNDPEGLRGPYPNTTSQRARGIWCRNMPDNFVENSVMYVDPDDADPWANFMVEHFYKSIGDEAVLNLEGGALGNADAPKLTYERARDGPAYFVGDVDTSGLTSTVIGDGGVPQSPAMAARGDRDMPPELPGVESTDSTTTSDRTLTIDGTDAEWTDYEFTVSETIENNPEVGTFGDGDEINGSTATGFVNGGTDGYLFTGELTDATVNGGATVLVDGETLDLSQFNTGPVIDRYEVTELDSKNPHADITVEWDVSDADGNLAGVTVEVVAGDGTVVDSAQSTIEGETAYGVDYFKITKVDGQTFEVRTTVTDGAGESSTATATVQE